jgi:colanic acid biosynthesis protein WcaH
MSTEACAVPGRQRLSADQFRQAVDMMPLVSIDMLVRDADGRYLLGLRENPPASGSWFVPGGRIRKGETLEQALQRLAADELAMTLAPAQWRFRGIYEHFYEINFAGETGMPTHYVVLAYHVQLPPGGRPADLPAGQHSGYRWESPRAMAHDDGIHPYTKAYFTEHFR